MAAREDLGVAEGPEAGGRRSAAGPSRFNDFGLAVFVVVLPVASIAATISLRWSTLVLWPATVGVVSLALRRARDRRLQVAWVEGTVLVVQDHGGVRRCDLAAVHEVGLTYTVDLRGDPSFRVLVARDEAGGPAVRFVLRDRHGRPLAARDLRLLAAALDASRVSCPDAGAVAGTLREIAEHGRERTSSERVDWRHRIGRLSPVIEFDFSGRMRGAQRRSNIGAGEALDIPLPEPTAEASVIVAVTYESPEAGPNRRPSAFQADARLAVYPGLPT